MNKGFAPTLRAVLPKKRQADLQPTEEALGQKRAERNARLIALLDSFDEGDADEQRRDLEAFQLAIDEDRPGQRRIFGEGVNKSHS